MLDSPASDSPKSDKLFRTLRKRVINWDWKILHARRRGKRASFLKLDCPEGPLYCIIKGYQYKDLASFPQRLVRRAIDDDCPIAIFFGDNPTLGQAHVFNPFWVDQHGVPNTGKDGDQWLDVPVDDGAILGDYITGRDSVWDIPP